MKAVLRGGFVVATTALAWFSIPAAVVAIVASILVALQAKAGTLIEISFGPLKAKLEREVTEAESLVKQLREFAALQAQAIVAAGVRAGRWSSESDWLYLHVKELETSLREMGVNEEILKASRREFVTYAIHDAAHMAMGNGHIPKKNGEFIEREWREALGEFPSTDPDRVEAFLVRHGLMNPDRMTRIEDMRWMIEHGNVRDAEQYIRTQKPVNWE